MANARNVKSAGSTGKRPARVASEPRRPSTGAATSRRKLRPVKKESVLTEKTERRDYPGGNTRR
jgi:hypothetical protein